jgi:glutamate dehydrogenase/leucine dehydrogenase
MGAKQWMLDAIYASLNMPQLALAQRNGRTAACPDRLFELDGYIDNMTGQGVFWAIEQALGGALEGARVLIQGFGVVGSGVAVHLSKAGAVVVGVSDRDRAILAPDGIGLNALLAAKDDNGLVAADELSDSCVVAERDDLLEHDADVLVLAAGSYLVDGAAAARIRAPLVVEAANLALRPAAREVLHANAVRVVPDVVANSASAALVGHQIASGNTRSPRELWTEIETNIKRGTDAVERASKQLGVDPKTAFRRTIAAGSNAPLHEAVPLG